MIQNFNRIIISLREFQICCDKVCYVDKELKKMKFYNFIKVFGLIKILKNKFDPRVRI